MRILPLDRRAIGQRLIYDLVDESGRVLLGAGTTITNRYLTLLQGRGYTSVPVDDALAADVVPTEPVPPPLRKQMTELVGHSFHRAQRGTTVVTPALRSVVNEVLGALHRSPALTYNLLSLHSLDTYFFSHAVNVCIYSLIIGNALALDPVDRRHLGVGAIMHDIGMVYHQGLLERGATLTADELAVLRQHTTDGFELLRRQTEVDIRSAHVALQHHEQLDGSGYPRGLQGDKIYPWAKVVAIAEAFDTATSSRDYGATLSAAEALDLLEADAKAGRLDPYLVTYFVQRMSRYPTGSIVGLRDGAVGIVVEGDVPGLAPAQVRVLSEDGKELAAEPAVRHADGSEPGLTVTATLRDYPEPLRGALSSGAPEPANGSAPAGGGSGAARARGDLGTATTS